MKPTPSADELMERYLPSKLARRYRPERVLIGPALYPHFITVVRIILAGAAGLALLTVGTSAAVGSRGLANLLDLHTWLKTVALYYQLVLSLFASAVIVFALLERFVTTPLADDTAWDPHDLPELPARENEYYGVARAVPRICVLVLLAGAINLFVDKVPPTSIPALAPLTSLVRIPLWAGALGLVVSAIVESIELLAERRDTRSDDEAPASHA
jgi:hypothetical protein